MATNELPPGYMWFGREIHSISTVERWARETMVYFDHLGPHDPDHWRNDPSYDWVARTKRKREGKLMKYRPQTAMLDEAMGRVVELPDRAALVAYLAKDLKPWGYTLTDADVQVIPYGFDNRIGWDTHLVTLRNKQVGRGVWYFGGNNPDYFGAIGYTDGPC